MEYNTSVDLVELKNKLQSLNIPFNPNLDILSITMPDKTNLDTLTVECDGLSITVGEVEPLISTKDSLLGISSITDLDVSGLIILNMVTAMLGMIHTYSSHVIEGLVTGLDVGFLDGVNYDA